MAPNFPTSLPSITNPTASDFLNSPAHHTQHSSANDELTAIATKVGIGSSTPTDNTVLHGTAAGASSWSQVETDDITNAAVTALKLASGVIVQAVYQGFSTETSWGDTSTERYLFQAAITPKVATSTIIAFAHVGGVDNAGAGRVVIRLRYNTTTSDTSGTILGINEVAQDSSAANGLSTAITSGSVALGNTSTTYFKLTYDKGDSGGTSYVCRYSDKAGIILLEVN